MGLWLALAGVASAADPWGRPSHLRAVQARPPTWASRDKDAPVRLWWDGGVATVAVLHRGRWSVLSTDARPGWISPALPHDAELRVRLTGSSRWSSVVRPARWQDPDGLAELGGWGGGADVVGEVGLVQGQDTVLASTFGGGLWVLAPGRAPVRLGRWEGLPDARVIAVHGGADGRIAAGTASGVALLDGDLHVTRLIDQLDGLPDSWVQAVRWQGPDRLWLGTYGGLARMEGPGLTLAGIDLAPRSVFSLEPVGESGAWVGYDGLRKVTVGQTPEVWLEGAHVYDVAVDGDAVAVATLEHGPLRLTRPGGVKPLQGAGAIKSFGLVMEGERAWVAAGDRGLLAPSGQWIGRAEGLPSAGVRSVARGRDGTLWLGTDAGLASLWVRDHGRVAVQSHGKGFPANFEVRDVAGGPDGLWLATDRGLHRIGSPIAQRADPDDLVVAMGADAVGQVVQHGGLAWAVGARVVRLDHRGRLRAWTPPETLRAGAWSAGHLWVGGHTGLWRLEGDRFAPVTALRDIRGLAADDRGLWVISGVSLFRVIGTAAQPYVRSHPPLAVAPAPDGAWLGTEDGLERLRLGGDDPGAVDDVLGDQDGGVRVPVVVADGAGGCWFGAEDGTVGHVSADGVVRIATLPAPDPPTPSALHPDGPDAVWVGTDRGLWRLRVTP